MPEERDAFGRTASEARALYLNRWFDNEQEEDEDEEDDQVLITPSQETSYNQLTKLTELWDTEEIEEEEVGDPDSVLASKGGVIDPLITAVLPGASTIYKGLRVLGETFFGDEEEEEEEITEEQKNAIAYKDEIKSIITQIEELKSNPLKTSDDKIDYAATQKQIDELLAKTPPILKSKDIDGEELNMIIEGLSENEQEEYSSTLKDMMVNYGFEYDEMSNTFKGENTEYKYDDSLSESDNENQKKAFDQLKQQDRHVDFIEKQLRGKLNQNLFSKRQEKLEQFRKGEIELAPTELAKLTTVNPKVVDYMKTLFPALEEIDNTEKGQMDALSKVVNTAMAADPRFTLVTNSVKADLVANQQAKIDELMKKYNPVSNYGLDLVKSEFETWWNNEFHKRLTENTAFKNLFSEYGIAGGQAAASIFQDVARLNAPSPGKIDLPGEALDFYLPNLGWVDEQVNRYGRDSVGGSAAIFYEKILRAPENWGLVVEDIQIALESDTIAPRTAIVDELNTALEKGTITNDMTLDEAMSILGEDSVLAKRFENKFLSNFDRMLWGPDDTVGDYKKRKDTRLKDVMKSVAVNWNQKIHHQRELALYKDYDPIHFAGPAGYLNVPAIFDAMGNVIDQAPHMIPTALGTIALTLSAADIIAGSKIGGIGLAGIGYTLLGIGSTVMGLQEYGSIWMEGTLAQIRKDKGDPNYMPTADEFVTLMKEHAEYGGQFAPITGALTVAGSEFVSEAISARLIGGSIGWLKGTPLVRAAMSNQFTKWVAGLGIGLAAIEGEAGVEYLTESWQSYVNQVATNLMTQANGTPWSSAFTQDIDWDQIHLEGMGGYNMAHILGVGGMISAMKNNGASDLTYQGIAKQLANNLNYTPGSNLATITESQFKQLNEMIEQDSNLTKEQRRKAKQEVSSIRNAGLNIPNNVDPRVRPQLIELTLARNNLENTIKDRGDKALSIDDQARVDSLNDAIAELVANNTAEAVLERNITTVRDIIAKNSDGRIKIEDFEDASAIQKYVKDNKTKGWTQKNASDAGTILQNTKTGEQLILINKEQALKNNAVNVGSHEFMHALLFETLKNDPKTAINLGNSLDEYLGDLKGIDASTVGTSRYQTNLAKYQNDSASMLAEEKLTLFADALATGDIKITESGLTFLGDQFRRLFQNLGLRKIRFNKARDVYNFIKDFNKSIEKGALTDAQSDLLKTSAKGTLVSTVTRVGKTTPTRRKSAKGELLNIDTLAKEYKDKKGNVSAANAESLFTQYQKIALKALGFDTYKGTVKREDAISFVNEQMGSILNRWNGKGLSNWIGANIAPKKAAFYGKEEQLEKKGKQTSLSDERVGQIADTVQQPDFDAKTDQDTGRKKVYLNEAIEDNVSATAKNQIKEDTRSTITTLANQGKTPGGVVKALDKEAKKSTWENVKGKMTLASQAYQNFVNELFDTGFVKTISGADMKSRFPALFNVKETGTTPTKGISPITGKSGIWNKQVFSIKIPPKQQLKDYFIEFVDQDLSSKQKSKYIKRAESLFNLIAKDISLNSLTELMNDTKFMDNLQSILTDKKSTFTAKGFMQAVEQQLDRRNLEDVSLDTIRTKSAKGDYTDAQLLKMKEIVQRKSSWIVKDSGYTPLTQQWKNMSSQEKTGSILWLHSISGEMGNLIDSNNFAYSSRAMFPNASALKLIKEGKMPETLTVNGITWRKGENIKLNEKGILDKNGTAIGLIQLKDNALSKLSKVVNTKTGSPGYKKQRASWWNKMIKNEEFVAANSPNGAKLNYLHKVAKLMEADLNANPGNIIFWENWLRSASSRMGHVIRATAPVSYFSIINKDGKFFIEEHTLPTNNVVQLLLDMAVNGTVDTNFQFIRDNYKQGKLLITDDNKVTAAGFGKFFETAFNPARPSTYLRYVNKAVNAIKNGINLNTYTELNGKTIAENLGLSLNKQQAKNPSAVHYQNELIEAVQLGMDLKTAQDNLITAIPVNISKNTQVIYNTKNLSPSISQENQSADQSKKNYSNDLKTKINVITNKSSKGISVFDFDDTLAKTKEKVIVHLPYYAPGSTTEATMKLTPAEFAQQAQDLESKGASFDFSQFEDVKGAKKGPLANLALKRQGKFGSGDIFILTARPQTSAKGIKTFLDGIGLNIPIENIIGLENGTSQAKAEWVLQKTAEGYNDFYFADDVIQNVKAVKQILDVVDVKGDYQVAKSSKGDILDKEFNKQIEEATGKEAYKEYSKARAKLEGKAKDKSFFKWLGKQLTITPSAEDFMGIMYDLIGKGEQGNRHAKFILDNLMKPFNKAEQAILSAKVTVANDFAALKKTFPSLRTKMGKNPLMQKIGVGPYTKSHAIRVYMWTKQGMDIPGLSKRDQNALVKAVEADSDLKVFADEVILIQKEKTYPPPGNNWTGGDMQSDIIGGLDKGFRKKLMTEFNENAAIIFSEKNMNKLEAIYGTKWVEALKDSLRRMKSGSNRPVYQGGGARIVNELLDWLNGSVGAIMFLNMRSGLLQLISNVNFINWGDNNMYQAAKAFASREYWPTVMKLMNSDYLVNRRDGLKINVNEAELADAAKKNGMKGAIAHMLDKGFIITRIMDSLAIATGGATFYINRRNALLKRQNPKTNKLYTKTEAEAQAFDDFYAISEDSQQSSNPSKISQQQASLAGRVILSFQNVTMQYNRKVKKAIRNLYNRRKNPGQTQRESDLGNLSQVIYYTAVQNVIFHALQQTLFALLFDDETDEEEKDRAANIANGMLDSLLFGLGFGGAAISTVKNVLLKVMSQHEKKNPKYEEAVWSLFDFSPVLDSKVRKIKSGLKTFSWNMEEIKKRGWSLDNPAYLAVAQFISATTNIPIDRVLRKSMNIRAAMDEETRTWQRVALLLGWDTWSVGLPYWGLQSTIKKEDEEKAKIKADYKADVRKIKGMGYKKVMAKVLKDYDLKDIIEMRSPAGTVVFYAKIKK